MLIADQTCTRVGEAIQKTLARITFISQNQRELLAIFIKTFLRDFILAWAVRGGVSFLPYFFKLVRLKG